MASSATQGTSIGHLPTFAQYTEDQVRIAMTRLDPEDPEDQAELEAARRQLELFSNGKD